MSDLLASVLLFTTLVMALVLVVLAARRLLAPRGEVTLRINNVRSLPVPAGHRLLPALVGSGIRMPAACGGKGTCGLCRVRVAQGGGPILPLEADLFTRRDVAAGVRLACQVTLREDIDVWVPDAILAVEAVDTTVRSNRHVATLLKELILELPEAASFPFRTGSFVQVTCPAYSLRYADIDVDPTYRAGWDRLGLWNLASAAQRETQRAYSLANHRGEGGMLMLVVRLAIPPPASGAGVPPGVVSSWLFGLRPGDRVTVSGPYGHFFVEDADRELVFVGGGAGMGPMRAHILDQLQRDASTQRITFFYGARNAQELLYRDLFDGLAVEHERFEWHAALSEPRQEDAWEGRTGFIHEHVQTWAREHDAPEACEYYLCGPPLMLRAVTGVLKSEGVAPESIHADDFGG